MMETLHGGWHSVSSPMLPLWEEKKIPLDMNRDHGLCNSKITMAIYIKEEN